MYTLYGIKNCDTMKKAMKWLKENEVEYTFHDYKKSGISTQVLLSWMEEVDWEVLLNKRGTTWRKLEEEVKSSVSDNKTAAEVMAVNTSTIKRPVLTSGNSVIAVGFKEDLYSDLFK